MTNDWLSETLDLYKEYESPTRYNYWSLLSAVSAILMDSVYIDRYRYKLYPNIYVLLFGPSGIRKGPPIALARSIVDYIGNTRVINGRSTVEGIIKEISLVKTKKDKTIINHNNAFITSSELSSSLVSNNSSLDVLTDLADRIWNTGEWTYLLKNTEQAVLKKPTITWLSASNEALFKDFIPEKNLKGGLIGRTFIIAEKKPNTVNSLMFKPAIIPDEEKIAKSIAHIKLLKGEFKMDEEVRVAFDTWYHKFKKDIEPGIEDESGTAGRIDDNILKIAMLISTARRGDLILTTEDIKEAMDEVIPLVVKAKKLSDNMRVNEVGSIEKRQLILRHLASQENFEDTQERLLKRFTLKMDHEDLDKIIAFLGRANVLIIDNQGGRIKYRLNVEKEEVKKYVEAFEK